MNSPQTSFPDAVPTDEQLMRLAAAGNLGAFEHLMLRYERQAWNTAFRFLGDSIEAEDVVQEAFLRIYEAAKRYEPTATFRTYLSRIITRLCIDFVTKKRPTYSHLVPEVLDREPIPLEVITISDRRQEVRQALDRLVPTQRMAIVLKYFEGLDYREIADAMETTTKSVEHLLARGRDALQRTLVRTSD